jgi:4-hydroxythreonine-4-phosphate dehydrogenase
MEKTRVAIVNSKLDIAKNVISDPLMLEMFTPVAYEQIDQQLVADYQNGRFGALTVIPLTEGKDATFGIEELLNEKDKGITMLLTEDLRMVLSPYQRSSLTSEQVKTLAEQTHLSLKRDFRISNPRIAILANTSKEDTIFAPVIKQLTDISIQAYGPYAAGDFFSAARHLEFDAVIATDNEQGETHFKNIAVDDSVKYIAGMSLVVTAPMLTEGTQTLETFENDSNKVRHAIYNAIDITHHRTEYDTPLANPLKKLYKDRKDDSEKARFNVPKNREEKL